MVRKLEAQILKVHQRLSQPVGTSARVRLENELNNLESRNASLENDLKEIQKRIDDRHEGLEAGTQATGTGRMPNESRRDYLIRTGKITPFSRMGTGPNEGPLASLHDALIDAEDERDEDEALEQLKDRSAVSHRNLVRPGFDFDHESTDTSIAQTRPSKRRKLEGDARRKKAAIKQEDSDSIAADEGIEISEDNDESADYVASEDQESLLGDEEEFFPDGKPERPLAHKKGKKPGDEMEDFSGLDDGDERLYQSRLQSWVSRRSAARKRASKALQATEGHESTIDEQASTEEDEWFLPHPTVPDVSYDNGYRLPGDLNPYLFDYQKLGCNGYGSYTSRKWEESSVMRWGWGKRSKQ